MDGDSKANIVLDCRIIAVHNRRQALRVGPPIEVRYTDSVILQLVALQLALTRTDGK
jgi:hypothetical protein